MSVLTGVVAIHAWESFVEDCLADARPEASHAIEGVKGSNEREAWQGVIDKKLTEWERTSDQLADEDVEPPSKETIQRAIFLAQTLWKYGVAPPASIVLDPNGGIVFERSVLAVTEILHVWDDGSVEYQQFRDTKLVKRRTLWEQPAEE